MRVRKSGSFVRQGIIHGQVQSMAAQSLADDDSVTIQQIKLVHEVAEGYYKAAIKGLAQHKEASFPPPFSGNGNGDGMQAKH